MQNVAVVGCGAIGLTTALAIQNTLGNTNVTIFAKDFSPNTTSDISAGFWEPFLLGNTPQDKVYRWAKITYDYLLKLWREGWYLLCVKWSVIRTEKLKDPFIW